jgi:hypothetical protein
MPKDDRRLASAAVLTAAGHRRDLLRILASVMFLSISYAAHAAGDPVRGQMLFNVTYACNACHDKGVIPAPGIFDISSGGSVNGLLFSIQETDLMASRYANTLAMNPTDLADVAAYVALGSSPNRDQHGFTGSWYEAATSGQGIEVEVYPSSTNGLMFVSWFTYDTAAGGADHQRWYTALGSMVAGQPIVPLTIYQNTGGSFDAPPITSGQAVGTATLYFDSCTSGNFSYSFSDGTGRSGAIPLTRLTQNVTCAFTPYPTNADFALSGNWFEAATSGQGFTVEVNATSNAFFLTWYTYIPSGTAVGVVGQRWYTALGAFTAGMRSIPVTIYQTTGGIFDTPTPPGQSTVAVGTGTMTFNSCTAAMFSYNFTGGTSSGLSRAISLVRVGPVPPGCTS